MSDICQVHLGPNGLETISVDAMKAQFRDEMAKSAIHSAGLVLDADQLKKHGATLRRLRHARFFDVRDGSHLQADIRNDNNPARQRRWLSVTRDMMRRPVWNNAIAQELATMPAGYKGRDSVPYFGRHVSDSGVDVERFVDEVDRLRKRGMLKDADLPDFTSDESMYALFQKVGDIAHEEAKRGRVDNGHSNRVVDVAPGLYLFSELLKRTEKLIEEDFTELWARRIFPILNLNTWMPQWMFQRIDDRTELPQYAEIERLPSNAPRGSENRDATLRNLAFYFHAASWSKLELMRYAEAQSNGAAPIKIDKRRIANATRMMNFKEDLITFFGDTDVDIFGLFTEEAKTGIERVPSTDSGGPFGSVDAEADRNLLIHTVESMIEKTEQVLPPDTIMLSTRSWLHVNKTLYGSVDSNAGDNKTVLEMAEQTLRKFGIKDILWVPEVGYSEPQEDRLKAHGMNAGEAQKYAGGDGDGKQAMVVCKRSADVAEMVVAKDRAMYPAAETRTDRVETRMMQGSGGLAVYKPEGYKIVTDVGPNP